jgi:hypothetical protein
MAAVFCVDCGQKLTGQYCGKCGRDYGATAAAQRASSPLATGTVQHVGSSAIAGAQQDVSSLTARAQRAVSPATAGAQRAVAEAQQEVSSSTAGTQRAVSPTSLPRSLSTPAGTRGRGPGGFTLGKNITGWTDCWPVNLTKKFRDEIATSCPGIELMYIPAGATVTI